MKTYTVKGAALQLTIKAENMAEAKRILSAPLAEVIELLKDVYFERI